MAKPAATSSLPHDWTFPTWPSDVYPYQGTRAKHLVRQNQGALMAAGALTRIGKHLVILGAGYHKWLVSNTPRVESYDVPANRPQHAHKRWGRARDAA